MVNILTTIESVTRCNCKTIMKTEEGYFIVYNKDDKNCSRYQEIARNTGKGNFLLSVELDRETGKYSGWLMNKLERVCPVENAIFYTYDELQMKHDSGS